MKTFEVHNQRTGEVTFHESEAPEHAAIAAYQQMEGAEFTEFHVGPAGWKDRFDDYDLVAVGNAADLKRFDP